MMRGDPQLPQVSEDEAIVPEGKNGNNFSGSILIMCIHMRQAYVFVCINQFHNNGNYLGPRRGCSEYHSLLRRVCRRGAYIEG